MFIHVSIVLYYLLHDTLQPVSSLDYLEASQTRADIPSLQGRERKKINVCLAVYHTTPKTITQNTTHRT
jgi:hypothetical protein